MRRRNCIELLVARSVERQQRTTSPATHAGPSVRSMGAHGRAHGGGAGKVSAICDCRQGRQIGQLARDVTRYSRRYTKGLSRVRGCFVIRLAERPCLLGKRIHLRLHELTLNSKNLLKILGLAQLPYAFGGSGDVSLSIGFHFFS